MTPDFYLRVNDLLPGLSVQAAYSDNSPIILTACTAYLTMVLEGSTAAIINLAPIQIVAPLSGQLFYQWQAGDTAVAGDYLLFVLVLFPGNVPMSVPNGGFFRVRISPPNEGT